MRFFLVPLFLASVAMAANMGMNIGGGAYNFGYSTGDAGGHSRVESGSGNTVSGSYSYVDANGDRRTVQYSAGPGGYQASGDIGVDRKTAAAAAALNSMAPKAPGPAGQMGGFGSSGQMGGFGSAGQMGGFGAAGSMGGYNQGGQWYNPMQGQAASQNGGYMAKW